MTDYDILRKDMKQRHKSRGCLTAVRDALCLLQTICCCSSVCCFLLTVVPNFTVVLSIQLVTVGASGIGVSDIHLYTCYLVSVIKDSRILFWENMKFLFLAVVEVSE